jgi:hypothetical protein
MTAFVYTKERLSLFGCPRIIASRNPSLQKTQTSSCAFGFPLIRRRLLYIPVEHALEEERVRSMDFRHDQDGYIVFLEMLHKKEMFQCDGRAIQIMTWSQTMRCSSFSANAIGQRSPLYFSLLRHSIRQNHSLSHTFSQLQAQT